MVRNTSSLGSSLQSAARRLIGVEPIHDGARHQRRSQQQRQQSGGPRRKQAQPQGQPSGRIEVSRGFPWDRPTAERQILTFGKGNTTMMLDVADRLFDDSPAAAIAAMHYMSEHQNQLPAASKLTVLQMKIYPHDVAIQNDRKAMSQTSDDGQLTVKLVHYSLQYLRYVYGIKAFSRRSLLELAAKLVDIADAFGQRPDESHKRQCQARFIAADIELTARQLDDRAALDFGKAIVLTAVGYDNLQLLELTKLTQQAGGFGVTGDIITQALNNQTSIELAREFVSSN